MTESDLDRLEALAKGIVLDVGLASAKGLYHPPIDSVKCDRLAVGIIALIARCRNAESERDQLRGQVYCPGLWRCAKCKLGMVCKSLNMGDGTVTANTEPQQCPNGCGPLWQVTERENRIEMQDGYEAAMQELSETNARAEQAESALKEAREALMKHGIREET